MCLVGVFHVSGGCDRCASLIKSPLIQSGTWWIASPGGINPDFVVRGFSILSCGGAYSVPNGHSVVLNKQARNTVNHAIYCTKHGK